MNKLMRLAVELARKGHGKVEPNPMVGALLLKKGEIIGRGYHKKFGGPHAEIEAIKDTKKHGKSVEGSVLLVTLEPCKHQGKTPPCTNAIIKEKIACVLYGEIDENIKMRGKGIKQLKKAGIKTVKCSTVETRNLYKTYVKNCEEKIRPYIHLKIACTTTGEITLKKGEKTILSSPASLKYVHELRTKHDGILVGRSAIEIDNPRLTVRHVKGKNPIRIVLDSKKTLSPAANVFRQPGKTLWVTVKTEKKNHIQEPLPKNTQIVLAKATKNGRIDLNDLMKKLLNLNIKTILAEGGETLNTELLKKNMVDEISICVTPKTSLKQKNSQTSLPKIFKKAFDPPLILDEVKIFTCGKDLWIQGKPQKNRTIS